MVAYSSTYCLPCLEGSDSPCTNTGTVCDPSTVWCDLVNIVEAQLNPIDTLISRTATAIPLASVTGSEAVGTFPVEVGFDTVLFDTDNMVNLDANPTIVTPRRNGMYMVYGRLVTLNEIAPLDGFRHILTVSSGSDTSVGEYPEVSNVAGSFIISTQKLFRWENGVSTPFQMSYQGLQPSFQTARLSVWWVCDL